MKTHLRNSTKALILLITFFVSSCSKDKPEPVIEEPVTPPVVISQTDIPVIDQRMEKFLTDNNFPGMSVAISKNGKLVYQKGFGKANVETGEKVTVDSRFRMASVSKLYTSVAIIKLVQDGRFSLTDKVFGANALLSTTYGKQPYKPSVTDITVSDLLHHTSGGWGQTNDPAFYDKTLDADGVINWTLDNVALTTKPGTSFAYSNFNYMLLSKIISRVTGMTYETFLKQEILDKVGAGKTKMAATSLAGKQENEVKYYGQAGDANFVYDYIDFSRADGAMGWLSNPKDMLLFCNAVDGNSGRPDLLTPASIALMTTTTPASTGFGFKFGCGWVVDGNEWFWWGSLPGSFSILYRNGNGICIAASANGRRQPNPENALNGFINIINFIATDTSIPWQDIDQF